MPTLAELVTVLRTLKGEPVRFKELVHRFDCEADEQEELRQHLDRLVDAGAVRHARGGRFLWSGRGLVDGYVRLRRDGKASLRSRLNPSEILGTLSDRNLNHAIDGDYVLATIDRRGPRRFARVLVVLERQLSRVIGQLSRMNGELSLVPEDRRLSSIRLTSSGEIVGAPGALAAVELEEVPGSFGLYGRLVQVFGAPDSIEAEIRALAFKYNLPHEFPQPVIEASAVPGEPEYVAGEERRDLRDLPLVTIDGASAKDFDDAVSARREGDGIRLWVCIADVSHYVTPGDPLDLEAWQRGTSVYFPDYCIPMLPERLSNDLCSLRPNLDRFVLCAELLFDAQGQRVETEIYPAVIRSRARWVYERVAELLDAPKSADKTEEPLLPSLLAMQQLATLLRKRRFKRGSLDFDLPEPEVLLDLRGRPDRIVFSDRTEAHRLIEELMLAANEAVATFLRKQQVPFLSRIHDAPAIDKLHEFQQLLASFNLGINLTHTDGIHGAFAELLAALKGQAMEPLLNRLLLRTMAQACYSPEMRGHFGLAADDYCHFTSPIRRYPDLMVHRALKQVWAKQRSATAEKDLLEAGVHCSTLERRAMDAEREIIQLKKCQFMEERVGEAFSGVIASVVSFGFFVQLDAIPVEGLVPLSTLTDDYYHFDTETLVLTGEKRRRRFQLGDKVDIIVRDVDLFQREINLSLARMEPAPVKQRKKVSRGRRRR